MTLKDDYFTGEQLDDILAEYNIIESEDEEIATEEGSHEFFDSLDSVHLENLESSDVFCVTPVSPETLPSQPNSSNNNKGNARRIPSLECPHCQKKYKSEKWMKKHLTIAHNSGHGTGMCR